MKKAIYPGSFDPITNGHLDILNRALNVFDEVTILVANNSSKKSLFSVEERVEMIKSVTKDMKNVKVDSYSGLTVEYAKKHGATHLIRGMRAVTDFEYEFQLATANEFVDNSIDMVFFMSRNEKSFISSSAVVELYRNHVDILPLVPKVVIDRLKDKIK